MRLRHRSTVSRALAGIHRRLGVTALDHSPVSTDTLTVASYNIHKCVGNDKRFNPARVAEVIAELDADMIALQEIDRRFGHRTGLLDAARITDPDTRQRATIALGAMQTALLLIDGIVQRAQTTQQVQTSAALRTFRLEQVRPYLDQQLVARETGYSFDQVMGYETQMGF